MLGERQSWYSSVGRAVDCNGVFDAIIYVSAVRFRVPGKQFNDDHKNHNLDHLKVLSWTCVLPYYAKRFFSVFA